MFDLPNLAPFLMQPGSPGMVGNAMGDVAQSIAQERAKQQQAQQFAANQQFLQQSLASEDQRAAAQLAEQHAYHGASLDMEQQQLDATQRQAQAKAIQGAIDTALKSGDPNQIKALMPFLQQQGIDVREMGGQLPGLQSAPQTQLQEPGAPPQLAAFSDMPHLSAPALDQPGPAPMGPGGQFAFSAGGKDLGSVDLKSLTDAQHAHALELARSLQQGSVPGEGPYRNPVIAAFADNPAYFAHPDQLVEDVAKATDPGLQRRQSGINASLVSQGQASRAGAGDQLKTFEFASNRAESIIKDARAAYDSKGLNQTIEAARQLQTMATSQNPIEHKAAMLQAVRTIAHSRVSNQEFAAFLDSGGYSAALENWLNKGFGKGAMSRSQLNMLATMANQSLKHGLKQRNDMAAATRDAIMSDPTIGALHPEYQESWARSGAQRILGSKTSGERQGVPKLRGGDEGAGVSTGGSTTLKGPPAAGGFDPDNFATAYGGGGG